MYKLTFLKVIVVLFAVILISYENSNHVGATDDIKEFLPEVFWELDLSLSEVKHMLRKQCESEFGYCLSHEELTESIQILHVITSLLDYFCLQGGFNIELFIVDGGRKCMEDNKEAIRNCVYTTYKEYFPDTQIVGNYNFLSVLFKPKDCENIERLGVCMTKYLNKCMEPTPAEIVEAAFKQIKKDINCKDTIDERLPRRVMSGSVHHMGIGLMALLTLVTTIVHLY